MSPKNHYLVSQYKSANFPALWNQQFINKLSNEATWHLNFCVLTSHLTRVRIDSSNRTRVLDRIKMFAWTLGISHSFDPETYRINSRDTGDRLPRTCVACRPPSSANTRHIQCVRTNHDKWLYSCIGAHIWCRRCRFSSATKQTAEEKGLIRARVQEIYCITSRDTSYRILQYHKHTNKHKKMHKHRLTMNAMCSSRWKELSPACHEERVKNQMIRAAPQTQKTHVLTPTYHEDNVIMLLFMCLTFLKQTHTHI